MYATLEVEKISNLKLKTQDCFFEDFFKDNFFPLEDVHVFDHSKGLHKVDHRAVEAQGDKTWPKISLAYEKLKNLLPNQRGECALLVYRLLILLLVAL